MKLQFSVVITIILLYTMTLISSTSKDHEVGRKKNTQNMEKLLNLNQNQIKCEQNLQDQQDSIEKLLKNQTSKYTGVCWHKATKKWEARLMHNKKLYYCGLFDHEEHAAMSVNLFCDKYEMTRKNSMVSIKADVIQQMLKNQTSIYTGVCWHKDAKKWQARLMHNKKLYYIGLFDHEEQAGMQVNLFCDKNGIERKNPMIIIEPDAIHQVSQTSKYTGVSWHKDNKKWQAQLKHNKKSYYGRYFDNEEHAAMTVNLLCDKYEIARKNPMINIKADVIQQVNQEIKVEVNKNGNEFKHECENHFMKSNDEESCVTTASGDRKKRKRKRKEEPIMDDVVEEKVEITTPIHDDNKQVEKIQKY